MNEGKPVPAEQQPHIALPDIDDRLAVLKRFETDLHNNETERGKEVLRQILEPRLPWFESRGLVILYHGSLQYNDPVNLDIDMDFVSEDLSYNDFLSMEGELEQALIQPDIWPRNPCVTNFTFLKISAIREEVAEIGQTPYDPEASDDLFADLDASKVLSARLLFPSQTNALNQYQTEIRQLATGSPWLQAGIVFNLNDAIAIRQARRK